MSGIQHDSQKTIFSGAEINSARSAMVLIHGRGASAENILSLTDEFNSDNYLYAAPQAEGNTWYPYSFLSPLHINEPGLSSGLNIIGKLNQKLNDWGIPNKEIILLGFSQGACLILEFAARNAQFYKGVIGLSGGLIGDTIDEKRYTGSFNTCPVFLGCSDIDPHVPKDRVDESAEIIKKLDGNVTKKIYYGMGHTINEDEINFIRSLM